ncbi:MAG: phosphoribosylamine--glycine ligase [Bacteroidales bacterium]|nr:phosphoribosylamine--glycine ligase [Bacteroidales bacterium]
MNILIIGSGGREHALAWKLQSSTKVSHIFIAPGNAGTKKIGTNLPIQVNDFDMIKLAVLENNVKMVIVGPEDPLVKGICDFFKSQPELIDVRIVGPDKNASQLEGSKEFAKNFMDKYHIPTARYQSFTKKNIEEAYHFMKKLKAPYVLKADGLAAGKGVLIIDDIEEAKKELAEMLGGKFGDASQKVVIEEFMKGIELSVFVLTDSKNYKILPEAKDYKRIGEGDTGLNTGGMGAVSPVSFADASFMKKVEEKIIKPTIEGIKKENMDYKGFIFLGLIKVGDEPFVIEYNVRMGDPETEVVIPRIKGDLFELLWSLSDKKLNEFEVEFDKRTATTVVLVSKGYPGSYEKGKEITVAEESEDIIVFHAGTKVSDNKIVTNGGRVLAVTSLGQSMQKSLENSYYMVDNISFEGKNFRKDIGFDL